MEDSVTVYITADTIISSLGFSTGENIQHIREYRSGIRQINNKDIFHLPFMGGQIDNTCLKEKAETRLEQLFILSIQDVIRQSGIDISSPECMIILSTTKGNINAPLPEMGKRIAAHWGLSSSPIIISNACISGVSALIVASRLIREGRYKHIVVAGGDELTRFVVTGFESFKSVSPEVCRPYDKARNGLSLGEACGAVLVTSDSRFVHDGQPIVIEGGVISNDANHISGPSRTGDSLSFAISGAMEENKLAAEGISFVNAHGTATVYNDEMESKALRLAGLDDKPLNSLKPYWGHTLGASGLIECIACMEELRNGELFGTLGFKESDTTWPLQVCATHQSMEMKRCLKTASGFGGCNAAIVLALEPYAKPILRKNPPRIQTLHTCIVEQNSILKDGEIVFQATKGDDFALFIRGAYKHLATEDRKFYKMDDLCKLGYTAAAYLLSDINLSTLCKPEEIGIILSNASASLDTDLKHQHTIDTLGDHEASPATFVYTLPSVVMGEICIRHNIKGENTFFISGEYDEAFIRQYAETAMKHQTLRACIIGWCELLKHKYSARFQLLLG